MGLCSWLSVYAVEGMDEAERGRLNHADRALRTHLVATGAAHAGLPS